MRKRILRLLQTINEIIATGLSSDVDAAKLNQAKTELEKALKIFDSIEKAQLGILLVETAKMLLEYFSGK